MRLEEKIVRQLRETDHKLDSINSSFSDEKNLEGVLSKILEVCMVLELDRNNEYRTEKHRAITEDGWELGLKRYVPRRRVLRTPVLLQHGFCQDSRMWEIKYAKYLAQHGVEVWLGNFRGRDGTRYVGKEGNGMGWNFDFFVNLDLPALVNKVLEVSKSDKLFLCGFSIGGKAGYSYLCLNPENQEQVTGLTTIASPARLDLINPYLKSLNIVLPVYGILHRVFGGNSIPVDVFGRKLQEGKGLMGTGLGMIVREFPDILYNPENVEQEEIAKVFRALNPASLELSKQLVNEILGVPTEQVGVVEGLYENVMVPSAVFSGSKDRLCYPASVFPFFEIVRDNNQFNLYHCFEGEVGYGHLDITMGKNLNRDVLPMHLLWMLCVEKRLEKLFALVRGYTNELKYGREQYT